MKLAVTICTLFFLFFLPTALYAQQPANYNEAFLQLNLRVEDYNKAHDQYVLKRSQYIKFKSLQSEKEAYDATVTMLQSRDDVVVAYINALKRRMEETAGVTREQINTFTIQLDTEIAFFNDHKAKIPSTGTLSDLVADSKKASDEYTKIQPLFYQTLFTIGDGKVANLRSRLGDNFTSLKGKVDSIRIETRPEYQFSSLKLQAIDRFIFESENKLARADEKKLAAEENKNNRPFTAQEYSIRINTLGDAKQLLKEAASFLKEIINEIKKQ